MHPAANSLVWITTAALFNSAAPQRTSEIVGRWQGAIEDNGATTEVSLEFFPNGTYARLVVVKTEFGWTQQGDMLLIAPALQSRNSDTSYGKASAVSVKVSDSVLVLADAKQSISMKRLTLRVNEAALIGRWEGLSDLNEGITQDFLSDGRLIVTVTLAREAGRYSVRDTQINWEVQIPTPRRSKSKFRLDGNKLALFLTSDLPALEMTRADPQIVGR
jgi:hypothetical protein